MEDVCGKDLAGALISAIEKQLGWKRRLASPIGTSDASSNLTQ